MDYRISTTWAVVIGIIALWELAWKGIALWKAAHKNQTGWFIALLIINTAGLLPITYLVLTRGNSRGHSED